MAKVRVFLENGSQFVMECESATARFSKTTGELVSFLYERCTNNMPLYLDLSKVIAVVEEGPEDVK